MITAERILRENLSRVQEKIEAAAVRSGRPPEAVRLVAITKQAPPTAIRLLLELGCHDLGESRPQRLWERAAQFPQARWHLVGHLQRNKVRRTLDVASLIHSVDSIRLLDEIQAQASAAARPASVLLEVNISQDPAKLGWSSEDIPDVIDQLPRYSHVHAIGLMGMASDTDSRELIRAQFASLRELRDSLVAQVPKGQPWIELSMGMSQDYEIAIEEGATIVRIGSALFEGMHDG